MRFISLFAGIGGIDLGLERVGHECVGQVEIDDYCTKVLEKHWPDVPRWRDIRELTGEELPAADLWTAGFPCQDLSNAGKREGIRGAKSGIFFDLMRLVRQVRPRHLLLENVPGLLVRGMGAVLGDLAESGYDAEWDCIPAAVVGAPHLRDRVFIMAHSQEYETRRGKQQQNCGKAARNVADANQERFCPRFNIFGRESDAGRLCAFRASRGESQWSVEPDVGRVAYGIPSRVDRLRCLGNSVVPQVAEYIGRLLAGAEEGAADG